MQGRNLVIGLLLFTLVAIIVIYFVMKVTVSNIENGMEPIGLIVEQIGNQKHA